MGVTGINKILFGGDKKTAKEFTGQANSQMNILIQEMSFQNLKQGFRKVQLYKNVWIECRKIFEYQECKIYVTPSTEAVACWFNDYFMEGIIVARHHDTDATMEHSVVYIPGADPPDTEEYHIIKKSFSSGYDRDGNRTLYEEWDLRIDKPSSAVLAENEIVWEDGIYPYKITPVIPAVNLYTVEVCMNGVLETIENVCGNNLAVYSVGQPVMVAKYNKEEPTYQNVPKSIEDPEYIITPFVLNSGTDVQFRWGDYDLDTENEWHDTVIYEDVFLGTGGIRLHENEDYNNFVVQPATVNDYSIVVGASEKINKNSDFRYLWAKRQTETSPSGEWIYAIMPIILHGDKKYYQYIARGAFIPDSISASDRFSGGGDTEINVFRRGSYTYGTFFETYLCEEDYPDGFSCVNPYSIETNIHSDYYGCCIMSEPSVSVLKGLIAYNDSSPEQSTIISWLDSDGYPTPASSGGTNFLILQDGNSDDDDKSFCVWDLDNEREASLLNYSGTGYITFPCNKSELQHWLTASDNRSSAGEGYLTYTVPYQGGTIQDGVPSEDGFGNYAWVNCDRSGANPSWHPSLYPGIDPNWIATEDFNITYAPVTGYVTSFHLETDSIGQCTDSEYHFTADQVGSLSPGVPDIEFTFSGSGTNLTGDFQDWLVNSLMPSTFAVTAGRYEIWNSEFCAIEPRATGRYWSGAPVRVYDVVLNSSEVPTLVGFNLTHETTTAASGKCGIAVGAFACGGGYIYTSNPTISSTLDWELSVGEPTSIGAVDPTATIISSGTVSATDSDPVEFWYYFVSANVGLAYNTDYTPIEGGRNIKIAVLDTRKESGGVVTVTNVEIKVMQSNHEGATPSEKAFSPYPELEAYMKSKLTFDKEYPTGEGNPEIQASIVSLPHSIPLAVNF